MDQPSIELSVRPADPAEEDARYTFAQERILIGRGRDCDLRLADPHKTVSRRHAEIRHADGRFVLVDLGSKNATRLNGLRLQPERPYPLRPGDRLRLGAFELALATPSTPTVAPAASDLILTEPGQLLTQLYTAPLTQAAAATEAGTLRQTVEELVILSELAFEIGGARHARSVMETVVHRAVQAVGAEYGVLALIDEAAEGGRTVVRAGTPPTAPPVSRQLVPWVEAHRRPLRLNGTPAPDAPVVLSPGVRSLLSVPLLVRGRLLGLLTLHNKRGAPAFTEADERLLAVMAAQAAQVIENARLYEEERRLLRVREELAAAQRIQASLRPSAAPAVPGYDLAGMSRSAAAVGGDYYDHLLLPNGRLALAVGDVSGKGLPAALLMAALQATLRSLVRSSASVRACLEQTNVLLREQTARSTFVTLCCGVLDPAAHRFHYANAGHPRPLLLHADGTLETLRSTAPLLGALAEFNCEEAAVGLQPGDVLLLYSDGVTEAMNAAREPFEEDRLEAVLRAYAHRPAAELIERIGAAVEAHAGDVPQHDDLTLLALRRRSGAGSSLAQPP